MRLQVTCILDLGDLPLIRRETDGIQGEGCRLVLDLERVLVDPHGDFFSGGQPIFPEEFPVFEPDVAVFIASFG